MKPQLTIPLFLLVARMTVIAVQSPFPEGHYRLKYYPDFKSKSGWDEKQIQREELLTIRADSTYKIERIYPQGGFEVIPDTGKWLKRNTSVILSSSVYLKERTFLAKTGGLSEPKCAERKDLSNVLWSKEE